MVKAHAGGENITQIHLMVYEVAQPFRDRKCDCTPDASAVARRTECAEREPEGRDVPCEIEPDDLTLCSAEDGIDGRRPH